MVVRTHVAHGRRMVFFPPQTWEAVLSCAIFAPFLCRFMAPSARFGWPELADLLFPRIFGIGVERLGLVLYLLKLDLATADVSSKAAYRRKICHLRLLLSGTVRALQHTAARLLLSGALRASQHIAPLIEQHT